MLQLALPEWTLSHSVHFLSVFFAVWIWTYARTLKESLPARLLSHKGFMLRWREKVWRVNFLFEQIITTSKKTCRHLILFVFVGELYGLPLWVPFLFHVGCSSWVSASAADGLGSLCLTDTQLLRNVAACASTERSLRSRTTSVVAVRTN